MSHFAQPNDSSDGSTPLNGKTLVNRWFAIAVIGLFLFACFYTLKLAIDLFLPIVLAGFLGFLLTPVTRWLKKMGLSNFWAPLLGTLLAVPILATFKIFCDRIEPLRRVGTFLGHP
jgi:predicted PurR-regulated permease PerM